MRVLLKRLDPKRLQRVPELCRRSLDTCICLRVLAVGLKWKQNRLADGYNIYFGKEPDKLYGSMMVYGSNEYYFTGMDRHDPYYFQIEAFNENGVSERTEVVKID